MVFKNRSNNIYENRFNTKMDSLLFKTMNTPKKITKKSKTGTVFSKIENIYNIYVSTYRNVNR